MTGILAGMRNNHTLLLLLEDIYSKNKKLFGVHQTITLAYSLISLDSANLNFINEINNFLINYDKKSNLTELLCYQVVTILLKRVEFSEKNLIDYLNIYKKFIDKNEVKPKQMKYISIEIKRRLNNLNYKKDVEVTTDLKKYMESYYKEINTKNNFYKYND